MYQSHFHLNSRPFASAPNPEHYFPAATIELARESLVLSVERSAGVAMLAGGVGSGKTMLCHLVAHHFRGELPVCMLSSERICDRQMLLQCVLHHLGLPYRNLNEGELRLMLADHLTGPSCPHGMLLIVDEADRLTLELLEEIRVITNLVRDGRPQVRLMLAGGPRLEERVGHPKMESLNQRVVRRLYLENFSRGETADYVRARITACGADGASLFTDDALQAVYQATHGIPRLVNQVCDHALILAAVNDLDQLDRDSIEEAWADLQRLPLPPRSVTSESEFDSQLAAADSVVEFGTLDDTDVPQEHPLTRQIDMIESQMDAYDDATTDELSVDISGEIEIEEEPATIAFVRHDFDQMTETAAAKTDADEVPETDGEVDFDEEVLEELGEEDDLEFEVAASDNLGDNDDEQLEFTIEQAANPFEEEFAEEEVVIQTFVSPAVVAGRDHPQVASAHSHDLARRLSLVQPPLKMHLADTQTTAPEANGEFQPLSAYLAEEDESQVFSIEINDESDASEILEVSADVPTDQHEVPAAVIDNGVEVPTSPGPNLDDDDESKVIIQFDPTRFDPVEDPVMPEFSVGAPQVMVNQFVPLEFDEIQQATGADIASQGGGPLTSIHLDEFLANLSEQSPAPEKKEPKTFRSLFSKMRRA